MKLSTWNLGLVHLAPGTCAPHAWNMTPGICTLDSWNLTPGTCAPGTCVSNLSITKSSKWKQKLYEKRLKHQTRETELANKSNKNLFESLKKVFYSEKISKYKHNAKKQEAL